MARYEKKKVIEIKGDKDLFNKIIPVLENATKVLVRRWAGCMYVEYRNTRLAEEDLKACAKYLRHTCVEMPKNFAWSADYRTFVWGDYKFKMHAIYNDMKEVYDAD